MIAALKFISHASAVKDIRRYLNGVLFEFNNDDLFIVATDGTRLAMANLSIEPTNIVGNYIIGNDDVKRIIATFAKVIGNIEFQIVESNVNMSCSGVTISVKPIDGVFPDWRRVVPDPARDNKHCPPLCSRLLAEAAKALTLITVKHCTPQTIIINAGDQNDVVKFKPHDYNDPNIKDAFVIIAPVRL